MGSKCGRFEKASSENSSSAYLNFMRCYSSIKIRHGVLPSIFSSETTPFLHEFFCAFSIQYIFHMNKIFWQRIILNICFLFHKSIHCLNATAGQTKYSGWNCNTSHSIYWNMDMRWVIYCSGSNDLLSLLFHLLIVKLTFPKYIRSIQGPLYC